MNNEMLGWFENENNSLKHGCMWSRNYLGLDDDYKPRMSKKIAREVKNVIISEAHEENMLEISYIGWTLQYIYRVDMN